MVDQVGNCLLVAGDETGGEDHGVSLLQLDLLVVVHGNAREGAHRFALGAGGDHADRFLGETGQFLQVDENIIRHPQVAEFPRNLDIGHH